MSLSPATGAKFPLDTHCGIDEVLYGGTYYERVGGLLTDGEGNPPAGWGNPYQAGWVTINSDLLAFTDSTGHSQRFQIRPGATAFKHICS